MKNFTKQEFNADYDHQTVIIKTFNEMGYSNIKIETSLINGLSHYIYLNVEVLNEGRTYKDMFCFDGKTSLIIRISDHRSGLEKNCGGICGNKMTLSAFKKLIQTGAIKSSN